MPMRDGPAKFALELGGHPIALTPRIHRSVSNGLQASWAGSGLTQDCLGSVMNDESMSASRSASASYEQIPAVVWDGEGDTPAQEAL
jgi:hypothetical protein